MRKNKVRRKAKIVKSRRHSKRRKNPTTTCPSCGKGNKEGKGSCWKCGWEFTATAKPHFGKTLKTAAKRKKKARRKAKRAKR